MIQEMFTLLRTRWDFFAQLALEHLGIALLSILLAGVLGLLLGIFISEVQKTSKAVLSVVNFVYTIPSISLLGFLIPLSGIGNTTAVIALTVYALLPMVRNTHTGITNVNPAIIEAARGMGSTNFQILYKIKLPLALPIMITGLRNMATMTIALAGIASFIGAGGLGVAIYRGITTNNTAMTLAGSLLIAVMALVVDFLLGLLEKAVLRRTANKKAVQTKRIALAATLGLCVVAVVVSLFGIGGRDTINIATKPMTEQYILGEMLKTMIEQDTDLTVSLTQGVGGGTANIQPALEKGDFDLYPEYTGTGWNAVLKREGLYSEALFPEMQAAYEQDLGLTWRGMYGFNNTYGLAVRGVLAREHGLETYSDLAALSPQLTFGAEYDFYERQDGYDALRAAYGYSFAKTVDMDIGLKYQAINQGKVDVVVISTTDGQISESDIVVLRDDKGFFPSYLCGNVVRLDTLEQYPALSDVLLRLENRISDEEMSHMNFLVESGGQEPKAVADAFLAQKGLLQEVA